MAWHAERQARMQSDLLGSSHPVLPEHKCLFGQPLRQAPGMVQSKLAAVSQVGLTGAGFQHGLPTPEDLAGRTELPTNQVSAAAAGGHHGHQVPGRRRVETREAWRRLPTCMAQGPLGHRCADAGDTRHRGNKQCHRSRADAAGVADTDCDRRVRARGTATTPFARASAWVAASRRSGAATTGAALWRQRCTASSDWANG